MVLNVMDSVWTAKQIILDKVYQVGWAGLGAWPNKGVTSLLVMLTSNSCGKLLNYRMSSSNGKRRDFVIRAVKLKFKLSSVQIK